MRRETQCVSRMHAGERVLALQVMFFLTFAFVTCKNKQKRVEQQ